MVYGIWNGMEGQSCALRSLGAAMPIYNAHQRIFEGLEGGGNTSYLSLEPLYDIGIHRYQLETLIFFVMQNRKTLSAI